MARGVHNFVSGMPLVPQLVDAPEWTKCGKEEKHIFKLEFLEEMRPVAALATPVQRPSERRQPVEIEIRRLTHQGAGIVVLGSLERIHPCPVHYVSPLHIMFCFNPGLIHPAERTTRIKNNLT